MSYNIAVLCGGSSEERDISIKSGEFIFSSIDDNKFFKQYFIFPEDKTKFLEEYKKFDLVIPVFHGVGGEDGRVFAFLDELGTNYLFSSYQSHCLSINKYLTINYLKNFGVLSPKTFILQSINDFYNLDISGKFFVKPNKGGSSLNNGFFESKSEAESLINKILLEDDVMIQEYIKGKELSVTVYGDYNDCEVAGITEIISESKFFDFYSKYNSNLTKEITPANISQELQSNIENLSKDIYFRLKLETVSRIDFLVNDDGIYFLEVNTIPGFTSLSISPKALNYCGFDSVKDFLSTEINKKLK